MATEILLIRMSTPFASKWPLTRSDSRFDSGGKGEESVYMYTCVDLLQWAVSLDPVK